MYKKDLQTFSLFANTTMSNTFVSATITNPVVMAGASASVALGAQHYDTLKLLADVNLGSISITFVSIKVEGSDDNSHWYQETSESIAAGVATNSLESHKFTASGAYRLLIPIKDRYIRVSQSATGTVNGETITITAVLCTTNRQQF